MVVGKVAAVALQIGEDLPAQPERVERASQLEIDAREIVTELDPMHLVHGEIEIELQRQIGVQPSADLRPCLVGPPEAVIEIGGVALHERHGHGVPWIVHHPFQETPAGPEQMTGLGIPALSRDQQPLEAEVRHSPVVQSLIDRNHTDTGVKEQPFPSPTPAICKIDRVFAGFSGASLGSTLPVGLADDPVPVCAENPDKGI